MIHSCQFCLRWVASSIIRGHRVVARIIAQLTNQSDGFHLRGATFSRVDVSYAVPTWVQIADSLRPGQQQEAWEGAELGVPRHGWQFFASQAHGVAPRPACNHPLHLLPNFLADPFRRARFPGVASPPPLAPSPSVLVRLPVWPSTRRLWPPPVCVSGVLGRRGFAGVQRGGGLCLTARAGW